MKSGGFLILDTQLKPLYADPESIRILSYPNTVSDPAFVDGILTQKILAFFPHDWKSLQNASTLQFKSGRRHYHCRAFILNNHWNQHLPGTKIALLIERTMAISPAKGGKQKKLAGMYQDPFGFTPDIRYFAFSRSHREVFHSLRSLIREGRGAAVLLSQAGMGKTLLLDYLGDSLRGELEIAVFPGSFEDRRELVRAVMAALGIDVLGRDLPANLKYFEKWLLSKHLAGRRIALICDDAQDYSYDTLESLFALSDLRVGKQKLLQIVLAGRQSLLDKLNGSRLKSVSDKINLFCRLSPLDEAEVRNYILHRLRIAGCTRPLFTSAALSAISLYSRGIPLNINMICRHSLSLAAAISLQTIDERVVADSAYDLVLRAQPADIWDMPGSMPSSGERRRPGLSKNRHGLRLVRKP